MEDSLLDTFKRYYADYRGAAPIDQSFAEAYQALTYHVINQTEYYVQQENLQEIRNLIWEFKEMGLQLGPSNDSLKEQFEQELVEQLLNRYSF
jgi:hypothetical protein